MLFSQRLKDILDQRGETWKEVSGKLNIGKNQQKYWEDRDNAPDGKTLKKLAEYFEVSSDYLLGIDKLKEKSLAILDDQGLTLTEDEQWFILKLRGLDKEGRTMVESTLIAETRRIAEKEQGRITNAG